MAGPAHCHWRPPEIANSVLATPTQYRRCTTSLLLTRRTSTAKNGGPTNVDGAKNLSELCDRSPADARGAKIATKR